MNIAITGGGTIAPIDDVRAITNGSTGRFAATLSEHALARGHTVWHVAATNAAWPIQRHARFDLEAPDPKAEHARIDTLRERWLAVRDRLNRVVLEPPTITRYADRLRSVLTENPIDLVFLVIAASDYEPDPRAGKIRSGQEYLDLRCRRAPKIIAQVRDWAPNAYIVGFKLLSGSPVEQLLAEAERSLESNRVDLVVANDWTTVRAGRHEIHLVRTDRPPLRIGPPDDPAASLIEHAITWAREARSAAG